MNSLPWYSAGSGRRTCLVLDLVHCRARIECCCACAVRLSYLFTKFFSFFFLNMYSPLTAGFLCFLLLLKVPIFVVSSPLTTGDFRVHYGGFQSTRWDRSPVVNMLAEALPNSQCKGHCPVLGTLNKGPIPSQRYTCEVEKYSKK